VEDSANVQGEEHGLIGLIVSFEFHYMTVIVYFPGRYKSIWFYRT